MITCAFIMSGVWRKHNVQVQHLEGYPLMVFFTLFIPNEEEGVVKAKCHRILTVPSCFKCSQCRGRAGNEIKPTEWH